MGVGARPAASGAASSSALAADAVGEGCGVGVDVGTGVSVGSGVLVGAGVLVPVGGCALGVAEAGAGVAVGAGGKGVGGTAGAATPHPANRAAKTIIGKTRTNLSLKLSVRINTLHLFYSKSFISKSFIPSWAMS